MGNYYIGYTDCCGEFKRSCVKASSDVAAIRKARQEIIDLDKILIVDTKKTLRERGVEV